MPYVGRLVVRFFCLCVFPSFTRCGRMGSQGKPIASIGFSRAVIYNRHQAGPPQPHPPIR